MEQMLSETVAQLVVASRQHSPQSALIGHARHKRAGVDPAGAAGALLGNIKTRVTDRSAFFVMPRSGEAQCKRRSFVHLAYSAA